MSLYMNALLIVSYRQLQMGTCANNSHIVFIKDVRIPPFPTNGVASSIVNAL